MRRVREWDDGDTVRAGRLAPSLETLAGGASGAPERRADPGEMNAGVRAFVGREGALIASALDRAARALQASPGDREPLYTVIRRMQSLRGLAELGDLVPLPEILDGIELAVGDLTRLFAPPPGVHEVMAAGASALTRLSRDIAEHGRPDPEAEEARRLHRSAAPRVRGGARRRPHRIALSTRATPRPRRRRRGSRSSTRRPARSAGAGEPR